MMMISAAIITIATTIAIGSIIQTVDATFLTSYSSALTTTTPRMSRNTNIKMKMIQSPISTPTTATTTLSLSSLTSSSPFISYHDPIITTTTASISISSSTSTSHNTVLISAAANTFDPSTFFSDVFGNVIGTPIILAIPIVAALGVATLIAYLIVAYANPASDDE
jgi:hypothetical protein